MNAPDTGVLYMDDNCLLYEDKDGLYLRTGEQLYGISCYSMEPCLYLTDTEGETIAVHMSFTPQELIRAAREDSDIELITGDSYDIDGLCGLLLKAIALGMNDVDISYLEGRCFIDRLVSKGAVSEETALDPASEGIDNPKIMGTFIHAKKVKATERGFFYVTDETYS